MAPLPPGLRKPSARTFRQQRVSGAVHPLAPPKTFRPDAVPVSSDFSSTKRDKRLIKHSTFLSRVAATSSSSSGVSKKKRTGRGRRGNTLATTLEGLADALPALEEAAAAAGEGAGRVRHSSIKSKKGALKRKERVVKGEMERFGASMAQLAAGAQQQQQQQGKAAAVAVTGDEEEEEEGGKKKKAGGGEAPQTSGRWAALRGYISSTMEQNPAFVGRS